MTTDQNDQVLERLSLAVRMELARIIDPRHDRDPDIVMSEIRQICEVMVKAVEKIITATHFPLDTAAAVGVDSAIAAQEESHDAESAHLRDRRSGKTVKGKR